MTAIPLIEITCQCGTVFKWRMVNSAKPKLCGNCYRKSRGGNPRPPTANKAAYVTSPNGVLCTVVGSNEKDIITVRAAEGEFVQLACSRRHAKRASTQKPQ